MTLATEEPAVQPVVKPLVRVDNLVKYFPIKGGLFSARCCQRQSRR